MIVGIIAALLTCADIVGRRRDATASRVTEEMIAWARVGDLSRLGLSREDPAKLEAARPWLGAHFRIVCGLVPGALFDFSVYEGQVLFSNGGHIYGDVDSVAGRVRWIHVASPIARQ